MSLGKRALSWIIGDDEDWEDTAYSRVLLVLIAALLMRMGFRFWSTFSPGSLPSFVATFGAFLGGVLLIQFAVSGLDLERWGRHLTAGLVVLFTAITIAAIFRDFFPQLGTDAALFSRYSLDLLMEGRNPYVVGMAGAFRIEGYAYHFSTPTINGGNVESLSYPAGAVIAYAPQRVLFGGGIRYTTLAAVGGLGLWFAATATPKGAVGAFASMILARNMFVQAAGGIFDILWILPLVVSMYCWYRERYWLAAVPFGVACSVKQQPWLITPFLAIWLWKVSDSLKTFLIRASGSLAAGLGTFFLINLSFILDAPRAWLEGTLTPLGTTAPLVHQGVGLAQLTTAGIVPLATTWHRVAVVGMVITLVTAYILYFDALQWVAWVFPMLIFLVHYRSLMSYFVAFLPIGVYALLLSRGEVEAIWATPVADPAEHRVEVTG